MIHIELSITVQSLHVYTNSPCMANVLFICVYVSETKELAVISQKQKLSCHDYKDLCAKI